MALALCALLAGCGGSEPSDPEAADAPSEEAPAAGPGNRPPEIESVRLEPEEPGRGDAIRAVVAARDPDGDRVELGYRWLLDGDTIRSGESRLERRDLRKGTRVAVVVTASDGKAESQPVRAETTVIDRPPEIAAVELSPSGVVPPGTSVNAVAAATDPDGDPVEVEYDWLVNGEYTGVRESVFSTEGLSKDDRIQVEVRATAGRSRAPPRKSESVRVGSAHPEIVSRPPGFREDGVFRYAVAAEDPDGDRRLRYRLARAPEGMVIDEVLGEIAWSPEPTQTGVHPVEVVVRDSTGLETTQSFEVTVRDGSDSGPPASADDGTG